MSSVNVNLKQNLLLAVQQERQPNSQQYAFPHGRYFSYYHPIYNRDLFLQRTYKTRNDIYSQHLPILSPSRKLHSPTFVAREGDLRYSPKLTQSPVKDVYSSFKKSSSPLNLEIGFDHRVDGKYNFEKPLDSLLDLSHKLIYHTVKWARSVPAFIELPLPDQIKLLEHSWSEIFILFSFQWKLKIDSKRILHQVSSHFKGEEETRKYSNDLKIFEALKQRFISLSVSDEEYVYLKSIALFKSGMLFCFTKTVKEMSFFQFSLFPHMD